MCFRLLLLLGFLLIGLFEVKAASAAQGACDTSVAMVVEEVVPGAFVRRGVHELATAANLGGLANIGFVIGKHVVAVIDTGGSACDGRRLRAAIAERTDLPIGYVINTHVHPDHIFGNAAFRADRPTFIGHHRLPRALAARGAHYLRASKAIMGAVALEGTKIITPIVTVESALTLDLGDRKLVLRAHDVAHTDHDLSVFDEETGTLWTGDLVFLDHTPVVDGSLLGLLTISQQLSALKPKHVVPGHGPAIVKWPEAIVPQQRYFETLAADLRVQIRRGSTMSEAVATAGERERERWQLFNEFNPRNATAGFAELEWE